MTPRRGTDEGERLDGGVGVQYVGEDAAKGEICVGGIACDKDLGGLSYAESSLIQAKF